MADDFTAGQRKHLIAEQYLEENSVAPGVFLILAAKAPATVWKVHRSARGAITWLEKKREHLCHHSFHVMDPAFGHLVIKMSGHPPSGRLQLKAYTKGEHRDAASSRIDNILSIRECKRLVTECNSVPGSTPPERRTGTCRTAASWLVGSCAD